MSLLLWRVCWGGKWIDELEFALNRGFDLLEIPKSTFAYHSLDKPECRFNWIGCRVYRTTSVEWRHLTMWRKLDVGDQCTAHSTVAALSMKISPTQIPATKSPSSRPNPPHILVNIIVHVTNQDNWKTSMLCRLKEDLWTWGWRPDYPLRVLFPPTRESYFDGDTRRRNPQHIAVHRLFNLLDWTISSSPLLLATFKVPSG